MAELTRIFNLNNPNQAREFLRDARIGDRQMTYVETADGVRHDFDKLTDDQAVKFAWQIWEMVRPR